MGSTHQCTGCGHASGQWFGRCPGCGQWSSARPPGPGGEELAITSLTASVDDAVRWPTGVAEVDRVLGGGLVGGSVVLLAGEPGIGKSTLVLQLLDGLRGAGRCCMLVTGEESLAQVGLRARRLALSLEDVRAAASTSLPALLSGAARARPDVLVVDSIQTLQDPGLDGAAGSTAQVRACAAALVRHAKSTGTSVVLVGHVTKEGAVAGPKVLEHVVDAVLALEGERGGGLRLLRAAKNRFGSCEETGVFTMTGRGLEAVGDPSAMLLADRRADVTGSVVFPSLEGTRPVLMELQALVSDPTGPHPRRATHGIDLRRLTLLLGVLAERAEIVLAHNDVFMASAGGLVVREPAADLALCMALFSAARNVTIGGDVVAVGEVGLGGEVRRVPGMKRRLLEAARLGFTRAIVPRSAMDMNAPMRLDCVEDVRCALKKMRAKPVAA